MQQHIITSSDVGLESDSVLESDSSPCFQGLGLGLESFCKDSDSDAKDSDSDSNPEDSDSDSSHQDSDSDSDGALRQYV